MATNLLIRLLVRDKSNSLCQECVSLTLPDSVRSWKKTKAMRVVDRETHIHPRKSVIGCKRNGDSRVEVSAGDVASARDKCHDKSSPGDAHSWKGDLAVTQFVHHNHATTDEDEEESCDKLCCYLQEIDWSETRISGPLVAEQNCRDESAEG